jgi:RNA polymerase sigma-70 factor (ECF subfamily)
VNIQQEFKQFIDENLDSAYRFAYSYMKERQAAEDVVHDSVVKAMKSLNGLRSREKMKPWFFQIINRTAIDALRRRGRELITEEAELYQMGAAVDDEYEISGFQDMIHILSPEHKSVLILHYLEDMSLQTVSKVLGVNENTVKTRLYRALKRLKKEMEEKDHGEE